MTEVTIHTEPSASAFIDRKRPYQQVTSESVNNLPSGDSSPSRKQFFEEKEKELPADCAKKCIIDVETPKPTTSGTPFGFEYLDHPADVQLHSWGTNMEKAMEQLVLAMYNYMTDLDRVEEVYPYYFEATGRDLDTLMFSLLHEPLEAFQSEPFFIGKKVELLELNLDTFSAKFRAIGESFDLSKHSQEADIKAITHSNMQITETENRADIFVIVDI